MRDIMSRKEARGERRSERELLEEVLEILRQQEHRAQTKPTPVLYEWKGMPAIPPGRLSALEIYKNRGGRAEDITPPEISPELVEAIARFEREKKVESKTGSKPERTKS